MTLCTRKVLTQSRSGPAAAVYHDCDEHEDHNVIIIWELWRCWGLSIWWLCLKDSDEIETTQSFMLQFCRPITKKRDCVRRWRKMQKLFKRKPDPRKVDSQPDASLFYYFLMDDMMATHRVLTICKNSAVSMGGVRAEAHVARNCKRRKGCFYIPHLSTKIWKTSIKIIPVPLLSLCSLPYMLFWIPHLLSSLTPSLLVSLPSSFTFHVSFIYTSHELPIDTALLSSRWISLLHHLKDFLLTASMTGFSSLSPAIPSSLFSTWKCVKHSIALHRFEIV